jgi:V/A-type H+/Na+-transporting ATPase subunit C
MGGRGNYAYACTRVKARKAFLLSKDTYSRLLAMDIHEIGRFLGETQYRDEMTRYGARYSGANLVEVAVTRNLAATCAAVLGFTKGHLREMVGNYLKRWDTFNVKTVLRGKIAKVGDAEVMDTLVPAGSYSEEFLRSLVSMATLQEVLDRLAEEPMLKIPQDMAREVVDAGKLAPLEDHLDKMLYYDLLGVLSPTSGPDKVLRDFVRREIDITNLKVLLKLKAEKISDERIMRFLVPGGAEYSLEALRGMAQAEGLLPVIEALERSSMYEAIKPALERFKDDQRLSGLTIALDKALIGTSDQFAHLYPLSVLPIVNFMIRKKVEVDNIRIIARGKESGLPNKVIEELLVV